MQHEPHFSSIRNMSIFIIWSFSRFVSDLFIANDFYIWNYPTNWLTRDCVCALYDFSHNSWLRIPVWLCSEFSRVLVSQFDRVAVIDKHRYEHAVSWVIPFDCSGVKDIPIHWRRRYASVDELIMFEFLLIMIERLRTMECSAFCGTSSAQSQLLLLVKCIGLTQSFLIKQAEWPAMFY